MALFLCVPFVVFGAARICCPQLKYQRIASSYGENGSRGGIVIAGSSIIQFWNTSKTDLFPLPTENFGMAGATSNDALLHIENIALIHEPKILVYYYGSNDSFSFTRPSTTLGRQEEYFKILKEHCPGTIVVFMSLQRAPIKSWCGQSFIDKVNEGMHAFCAAHPADTVFFDSNASLEESLWKPKKGMYRFDGLHLTAAAYELLAADLKPILQRLWDTSITQALVKAEAVVDELIAEVSIGVTS